MSRIMYRKMTAILISILFFSLIECQDWCPLIRPNLKYEGLGITNQWNSLNAKDLKLVMYNKAGKEWVFKITGPHYTLKDMRIQLEKNSVAETNGIVLIRFGVFYIAVDGDHTVHCLLSDKVCILLIENLF